ncbi:RNA polymerase sigma factor for late transcription [Synechococcus phage S-CREM2]|nr:RNA polymerase sigma factor for late transcription [Synechococcus phage S-CREM2]
MTPAPRKRRKNNFIDNKEFYAALVSYRKQCQQAEESGEPTPVIPRYIGKCFLDIAEHLSMRPNFSNYMYRQDMVMDAVENCVLYWHRFDPERSTNPFSYFTQVCWYAFLRRIGKEKRQIEICDKIISKSGFEELFQADALGSSADYNSIKDAIDQRRRGNK